MDEAPGRRTEVHMQSTSRDAEFYVVPSFLSGAAGKPCPLGRGPPKRESPGRHVRQQKEPTENLFS